MRNNICCVLSDDDNDENRKRKYPDKTKIAELSQRVFSEIMAIEALNASDSDDVSKREELQLLLDEFDHDRKQLVLENIPLAWKIARETWSLNTRGVNDFNDYYHAAVEVLCSCAVHYNPENNASFGTYAYTCIKNRMILENAGNMYALRIPEKQVYLIAGLKNQGNGKPGAKSGKKADRTLKKIRKLAMVAQKGKSLQETVNTEDGDLEFGEILADKNALTGADIEAQIDKTTMMAKFSIAFKMLTEEEQAILRCRYGLDGEDLTIAELADIYHITPGQLYSRQLEAQCNLRKNIESLTPADVEKFMGEGNTFTPFYLIIFLLSFSADMAFHSSEAIFSDRCI